MTANGQLEAFERFVQDTFDAGKARAAEVGKTVSGLVAQAPALNKIHLRAGMSSEAVDTALGQIGKVVAALYVPVAGALATMVGLPALGVSSSVLVAFLTLLVFAYLVHKFAAPLIEPWIEQAIKPIKGFLG